MALSVADGYVSRIRRQLDRRGFSGITLHPQVFTSDGHIGVLFPDGTPEFGTPEEVLACIRNAAPGNVRSLQAEFEKLA